MLQNLSYFWNTKTYIAFFHFSFHATTLFFPNEWPGLCRHRPGHSLERKIKYHEMKKKLHGFSNFKNMANFEAFNWNISASINLLFLKSGLKGIPEV